MARHLGPSRATPTPAVSDADQAPRARSARALALVAVVLLAMLMLVLLFVSARDDQTPTGSPDGSTSADSPMARGDGRLPYSGVPGDLDGDGEATATEEQQAASAREDAKAIEASTGPAAAVTSTLLTPPGTDWWHLVSSQATQSDLWAVEAPAAATWYSLVAAEAKRASSSPFETYDLVTVGFPDIDVASSWVGSLSQSGARFSVRYRYGPDTSAESPVAVSIAPAWVDLARQPLREQVRALFDTEVSTGTWVIDFTEVNARAAAESRFPAAYTAFWNNLGFDGPVTWQANSRDPYTWSGSLKGWQRDDVDLFAAATALAETGTEDDLGLGAYLDAVHVTDSEGNSQGLFDAAPDAPDGADLVFSASPNARGAANGSEVAPLTPVSGWGWWIDGDVLTMSPSLAPGQ